jgi:multiple sugar transport system substrate-binding protein
MMRKCISCSVVLLFLLVGAAAVFAGGGQEKIEGPATVQYWTHMGGSVFDFEGEMIEEWEAGHPDIRVEYTGHGAKLPDVLNIAFNNDEGPDLYRAWMSDRTWVELGRMADLSQLFSPEHLALYAPYYTDRVQKHDGKIYGQMQTSFSFRFIINRDLFRASGLDAGRGPETYQEWRAYARKITAYGSSLSPKAYGFALPVKETWIWEIYADQFGYAGGVNFFDWKTLKYQHVVQKPVLRQYLSMLADGSVFPGHTTLENDPARAQFAEGVIGMMAGGSWNVGVWNHQFPTDVDWAAVRFPTPDGKIKGKTRRFLRNDFAINPKSSVQKQSAELLEYLTGIDYLVTMFERGIAQPFLPEVYKHIKTMPPQHGWEGFLTAELDSPYPPEFTGLPLEGDDRGTVYTTIAAGRADLDAALVDLDKRYNAALQRLVEKGVVDPQNDRRPNYDPMKPLAE